MQEAMCCLLPLNVVSDVMLETVVAIRGDSLRTNLTQTWVLVLWLNAELANLPTSGLLIM